MFEKKKKRNKKCHKIAILILFINVVKFCNFFILC